MIPKNVATALPPENLSQILYAWPSMDNNPANKTMFAVKFAI